MGFWTVVFGFVLGHLIYDLMDAILCAVFRLLRDKKKERKIGFGNSSADNKKPSKGAQMRRIGFGEHD